MIASAPLRDRPVPARFRSVVGDAGSRLVWRNEVGGLTWELSDGRFLKWSPRLDLRPELDRLRWSGGYAVVPTVLGGGRDWLSTSALPGSNAVVERWRSDPARAVAGIGRGLRQLHDALPVDRCPFDWSIGSRLADARSRAGDGRLDERRWRAEHDGQPLQQALERAEDAPPIDRLVVCHGDACAPNTLLDVAVVDTAHVDLGSLGVADRWADLAVATWSTEWNYGPGWERALLDAYGVDPDPVRTAYYRLLWTLDP